MTAMQWPPSLVPLVSDLWRDIQRSAANREAKRAAGDPRAHKLSRVFNNSNYRYWPAGKDGRGRIVRFCWSSHRNVAGYFLGWREVEGKKQTKRDMWVARKVRTRVQEIARSRRDRLQERRAEVVEPKREGDSDGE